MSRIIRLALALALILLLSGCASLLERSYSVVEPYAVRYWDSGGSDTLRAENYQDLVNSLLMLVEQRSEEGVIRCYGEAESYTQARSACREVRNDTMLGSYLLEDLRFTYSTATGCSTLTLTLTYRADAEDPEAMMTLSDSQSLVDLLRIDVREGHERLTARFVYDTSREEVSAAMDALWLELCQGPDKEPAEPEKPEEEPPAPEETETPTETEKPADTEKPDGPEDAGEPYDSQEDPEAPAEEPEAPPSEDTEDTEAVPASAEEPENVYPLCPWTARYYPDQDTAGIVEILLDPVGTAQVLREVRPDLQT